MRKQFLVGYCLFGVLLLWSLVSSNFEFVIYAAVTVFLLGLIHWSDKFFHFSDFALWGFDLWMILHILGGLFVVGDGVLYSFVLFPLVGEPYNILKYDQVVHAYCYFVVALLMWSVVKKSACCKASFATLATITVLAATGVGGLNEIVEFLATVFVEDVNVGGYENTAIDIVANLLGALCAVPLMRKIFLNNKEEIS